MEEPSAGRTLQLLLPIDVPALGRAYPRVPSSLGQRSPYRDPYAIRGGTYESLERVQQRHGYYSNGRQKLHRAAAVAEHMNIEENRSRSFHVFRHGLRRLVGEDPDA